MAHATKVLAIFLLALAGALPAHAELSAPQMELARLAIKVGGFPVPALEKMKLNCPKVEYPNSISMESHGGYMHEQFEKAKECTDAILAATTETKFRRLIESAHPNATGSQTSTLLGDLNEYYAPFRETLSERLSDTKEKIRMLARPFVLKDLLMKAFNKEIDACPPPVATVPFTSPEAARKLQSDYRTYESCVHVAARKIQAIHDYSFIQTRFASESERTRNVLLLEFPNIKSTVTNMQNRTFGEIRWDAHNYLKDYR